MDCAGCAGTVDGIMSKIAGVVTYKINFSVSQLRVEFDRSKISQKRLMKEIERAGYPCAISTGSDEELLKALKRTDEAKDYRNRFLQSLVFSIPLFLVAEVIPSTDHHTALSTQLLPGLYLGDLLAFLLVVPLLWIGRKFYTSTYAAMRTFTTNIDTLITLGITAAFVFSTVSVIVGMARRSHKRPEAFFETSGELISFILFGRWLESAATGKTAEAMSSLLELTPRFAIRICDNIEEEVPLDLLRIGDVLRLSPSSRIAADGVVLEGAGNVDESMLTGESLPIYKVKGDRVSAGTLNIDGALKMQVDRLKSETQLSQIIKLMQDSQSQKAKVQLFADKVSSWFTPIVIGLAVSTFIFWVVVDPTRFAVHHILSARAGRVMLSLKLAVAVVVVSCPCALGVATPAAFMVGSGVASKRGILIKGSPVLEAVTGITDIVFDKTRTLTTGEMKVSFVYVIAQWQGQLLWQILSAAEAALGKAHPISSAVINHAATQGAKSCAVRISNFRNIASHGVACTASKDGTDHRLLIGNASLFAEQGIAIPTNPELPIPEEVQSDTQIYVAINDTFVATLTLSDTIKPDAKETIDALRSRHRIWMLTGDSHTAAQKVALALGIENIRSSYTVSQKQQFIAQLQAEGRKVMMIGDGINDAPALITATVGVSMIEGTQIAIDAADIVLTSQSLSTLPALLSLSRTTFNRIKLNLAFAFAWNLVAIPFAMGAFLPLRVYVPPALAGSLMALTCICIVLSSLQLRWTR